jgi:glyoxylase-like metal-dependent hydrolase (beta-lactamase superfamily II)
MPPPPHRYRFKLLRAAQFKLDGGSMFGLIPRVVWSKSVPTDDQGRIAVQHNCLLLERVTPGDGPRRVLIEVGSGDKLDPKMQSIFGLEKNPATGRVRSIIDALAEINVAPESVDAVVVTHLHFDHAGALTRLPRPGEQPTFPFTAADDGGGGSSQSGGCCLTFPNAPLYAQAREWADARANRSVMTKTYFPDHLIPIESKLKLIDSPRAFPIGSVVDRDQSPPTPVELRETELWPGAGISVFLVPGHTWGQQAIKFTEPGPEVGGTGGGGRGRTIVFTPDVMPTVHHCGPAYSLAYDVEPYTSMVTRRWFLTEAAARDWVLCLDHEPGHPLVRVRENGKGWFELISEPE